MIDIKKEFTYEKGKRSKVLSVYAITSTAKEINEKLCIAKFSRYKYISYKNTTLDTRLASMYTNEMKNIKARYETIFNTSLKDMVLVEENTSYRKLEKHLMMLKHNGEQLFLAAEQGSGKFEDNITVVINPRTASKSRRWLAIDSKALIFKDGKSIETSVNAQEFELDIQYNEQLKEFLKPTLQLNAAKKVKSFGKIMKTYIQAVGIQSEKTPQKNKDIEKEKKNNDKNLQEQHKLSESKKDLVTKEIINQLSTQINQLKEIIHGLCHTLVQNEQDRNKILQKMNEIGTINVENDQQNDTVIPQSKDMATKEPLQKEIEKRKDRESNRAKFYQFTNEEKISGKIEFYNNWAIENSRAEITSVKRIRRNKDS